MSNRFVLVLLLALFGIFTIGTVAVATAQPRCTDPTGAVIPCPPDDPDDPPDTRTEGDRDGDGTIDVLDACPDTGGPNNNRGCPEGVDPDAQDTSEDPDTSTPPELLPLPQLPQDGRCVLAAAGQFFVNVREAPSTDAAIVDTLGPQDVVAVAYGVMTDSGQWYKIINPNGYVSADVVRTGGMCFNTPFAKTGTPMALVDNTEFVSGDGIQMHFDGPDDFIACALNPDAIIQCAVPAAYPVNPELPIAACAFNPDAIIQCATINNVAFSQMADLPLAACAFNDEMIIQCSTDNAAGDSLPMEEISLNFEEIKHGMFDGMFDLAACEFDDETIVQCAVPDAAHFPMEDEFPIAACAFDPEAIIQCGPDEPAASNVEFTLTVTDTQSGAPGPLPPVVCMPNADGVLQCVPLGDVTPFSGPVGLGACAFQDGQPFMCIPVEPVGTNAYQGPTDIAACPFNPDVIVQCATLDPASFPMPEEPFDNALCIADDDGTFPCIPLEHLASMGMMGPTDLAACPLNPDHIVPCATSLPAMFDPLVPFDAFLCRRDFMPDTVESGPDGQTCVGMLLPAVQKVRDAAARGY